jgi:hypothetical protein
MESTPSENSKSQPVLSYATSMSHVTLPSRYGVASVCVSISSIIWLFLPGPFELEKHNCVGSYAALLGILLAIAAYRQPGRARWSAHVGMTASLLAFWIYLGVKP